MFVARTSCPVPSVALPQKTAGPVTCRRGHNACCIRTPWRSVRGAQCARVGVVSVRRQAVGYARRAHDGRHHRGHSDDFGRPVHEFRADGSDRVQGRRGDHAAGSIGSNTRYRTRWGLADYDDQQRHGRPRNVLALREYEQGRGIPSTTCGPPTDWSGLTSTQTVALIDGVNLNGTAESDAALQTTLTFPPGTSVATGELCVCFTPVGRSYVFACSASLQYGCSPAQRTHRHRSRST